jgi:hypothetical protein
MPHLIAIVASTADNDLEDRTLGTCTLQVPPACRDLAALQTRPFNADMCKFVTSIYQDVWLVRFPNRGLCTAEAAFPWQAGRTPGFYSW